MNKLVAHVMADPRYITNIEYGQPRSGHPEGTVKAHIAELEANLDALKPRIADEQTYWKLKFLIHMDTTIFNASRCAGKSGRHALPSIGCALSAIMRKGRSVLWLH